MIEDFEKLLSFDNDKLIDVVKNYKQYGYNSELRNKAISILEQRGISKEQLQLTGNFENQTLIESEMVYKLYRRHSRTAFLFYLLAISLGLFIPILKAEVRTTTISLSLASLLSLLLYIIYLAKSFIAHNKFRKLTGNNREAEIALQYAFIGMPFYFIMYFYFRQRMKEEMKLIR